MLSENGMLRGKIKQEMGMLCCIGQAGVGLSGKRTLELRPEGNREKGVGLSEGQGLFKAGRTQESP